MKSNTYSYCFLRYRQDPESGEFANIGLALWSRESRFLAFQGSDRYARLKHFFGDLDDKGFRLLVAHVERRFDALAEEIKGQLEFEGTPDNVHELARKVVPQDDGSLIWGPARGGFTENPSEEMQRLYDRYIGRHYQNPEKARRDEPQVFREVYRKAFENKVVASRIQEHEIVAPLASHVFKHAWKNGVWNVYETISFDLLDSDSIERKAHTWYGRSVHLLESEDKPKLHLLLGKPSLEQHSRKYGQAKRILESVRNGGVRLIEEDDASQFADELELTIKNSEAVG